MKLTPQLLRPLVGILFAVLLCSSFGVSATSAQGEFVCPEQIDSAEILFNCLTVEERIGQLFLITFEGDTVFPEEGQAIADTAIADLILNYHVGGVALQRENDNITGVNGDGAMQAAQLIAQLQALALSPTSQPVFNDISEEDERLTEPLPASRFPLPLLIAATQGESGDVDNTLLAGLNAQPSEMAIGATWNRDLAEAAGTMAGRDLSALGINMLFGPSMNVVDSLNDTVNLGTHSFGGDPYWVGVLSQAYLAGLKQGSDNQLAVIGREFPGYGGSDTEIATVRKSPEQLATFDLLPFFAVTEPITNSIDGLLTANIRYQGFDGNIRSTTPPVSISLDAQAELFAFPQLATWRDAGGIVVSAELGSPAMQRFYNENGDEFPHRQIAKDAFAAGNDLLYVSQFALGGDSQAQVDNIRDTITWFVERYRTEPAFQQQVDTSVRRILALKGELYGFDFSAESVIPPTNEEIVLSADTLVNLPASAISLIFPNTTTALPVPPTFGERIVVFTDAQAVTQCADCPIQPLIDESEFAARMIGLYGPDAANQIDPTLVSSFSFDDLAEFLDFEGRAVTFATPTPIPTNTPEPDTTPTPFVDATATPTVTPPAAYLIDQVIDDADWIILNMLDESADGDYEMVHRFLAQRSGSEANHVVAFAYGAPNYLDAAEILKLSAYYGVFSHIDSFVNAAVQTLFQDITPSGQSPVSIRGVGYDLFTVTEPNPNQRITLNVVQDGVVTSPSSEEPINLGGRESLLIQTGIIYDRNGNVVPDGTQVQFVQQDFSESQLNVLGARGTLNGIASYTFTLPEAFTGRIRIQASAGDAVISDEVNIVGNEISVATPTPEPTATPQPTETPTPTDTPTPLPTQTPLPTPTPMPPPEPGVTISVSEGQTLLSLFAGLLMVGIVTGGIGRNVLPKLVDQMRLFLWGIVAALIVYNYVALNLPGAYLFTNLPDASRSLVTTLCGGILGVLVFYIFHRQEE